MVTKATENERNDGGSSLPRVKSSSKLNEDTTMDSTKAGAEAVDEAFASLEHKATSMIDSAMERLTTGLPRYELDLIVKEADECERALLQEIAMLEKEATALSAAAAARDPHEQEPSETTTQQPNASSSTAQKNAAQKLEAGQSNTHTAPPSSDSVLAPFQYGLGYPFASVDDILSSDYSTVDRFITLSALLGRLFWPVPLPDQHPHAIAAAHDKKKIPKQQQLQQKQRLVERQQQLLALQNSPIYTRSYAAEEGNTTLLGVWKKISSHKTALVFRKPVTDKDAPGYSDRIFFPMDLSLVRKLITSQQIQSFADLHAKIALICHNCMKFNGGASDYGIVAKEFETFVDDAILTAVANAATAASRAGAAHANVTTAVSNPSRDLAVVGQGVQEKVKGAAPTDVQPMSVTSAATTVSIAKAANDSSSVVAEASGESNGKVADVVVSASPAKPDASTTVTKPAVQSRESSATAIDLVLADANSTAAASEQTSSIPNVTVNGSSEPTSAATVDVTATKSGSANVASQADTSVAVPAETKVAHRESKTLNSPAADKNAVAPSSASVAVGGATPANRKRDAQAVNDEDTTTPSSKARKKKR